MDGRVAFHDLTGREHHGLQLVQIVSCCRRWERAGIWIEDALSRAIAKGSFVVGTHAKVTRDGFAVNVRRGKGGRREDRRPQCAQPLLQSGFEECLLCSPCSTHCEDLLFRGPKAMRFKIVDLFKRVVDGTHNVALSRPGPARDKN